jgi:hypothetical protein
VPPIALLAAVHGIALAVRAGASGRVYRWAIGAVASIGAGAFALSFLALRDLMQDIGYSPETAWIFPALIDTAVAVSTLMLVALGDSPARRSRAANVSIVAAPQPGPRSHVGATQSAKLQRDGLARSELRSPALQASVHTDTSVADAGVAADLIASRVTTQSPGIIISVLAARRRGATVNAAAKEAGVNYRTAQRILEAAASHLPKAMKTAS